MAEWTPRTGEFTVNATIGSRQSPAVAALPSGGYVVVWSSVTPTNDIILQRYDAAGGKVGAETVVNSVTASWQLHPSVAALQSGGYVVTWSDSSGTAPDGSEWAVRAQLFDAAGNKVGGEFLANTTVANAQWFPTATALEGGGFVISWQDKASPGWDTQAQIFDANGNRVGGEFFVSAHTYQATTDNGATTASLAPLASGGFVSVWAGIEGLAQTPNQPGDPRFYIAFQRFGPSGGKEGGEVRLLPATHENVFQPKVAALENGTFIVTWTRLLFDGSAKDVRGQVFDASGQPVGAAFTVNSVTAGDQIQHEVSALPDGGFVVTWTDDSGQGGDSSSYGIKGQMFDPLGNKLGPEFLVNADTASIQQLPAVVALASGEVLMAWQDHNQDRGPGFEDYDIKARIFFGTSGSATFHGTAASDQFSGTEFGDAFVFGPGTFAASDKVDGAAGTDRLALAGPYGGGVVLQAETLANVEIIQLGSAAAGAYNSYNLTMHDGNVAAGQTLTVDGSELRFGESLMFYGGAETDGRFGLRGGASIDYIFGSQNADTIRGGLAGDHLRGNGGDDTFLARDLAELRGDDIGGGAGTDTLVLTGQMDAGAMVGVTMREVEAITVNSARGGGYYSYNLTLTDATVAAGQTLTVDASNLALGESLMFYGDAETDGRFVVNGGASTDYVFGSQNADTIRGGLAGDYLRGNGGADTFAYGSAAESSRINFDQLVGFDRGADRIDLPFTVIGTVTQGNSGRLSAATFDADLAAALNGLDGRHAHVFNPDSGDYAGHSFLIVDGNGNSGYQAGEDYVFELVGPTAPMTGTADYFV